MMTRSTHRLAAAFLVATTGAASLAFAQPGGGNLIVNGDAEAGAGAASSSEIVAPPGWRVAGQFTAVQYGASGGFPDKTTAGPPHRGQNFFAGGNAPLSTASQAVSLADYGSEIATGKAKFVLDGWLGGYGSQGDFATVTMVFKNQSGATVGAPATLGPVTPADRNNQTGSVRQTARGLVPAGAASARVTVTLTRLEGAYNDGPSTTCRWW
jgi:hypothetical protein